MSVVKPIPPVHDHCGHQRSSVLDKILLAPMYRLYMLCRRVATIIPLKPKHTDTGTIPFLCCVFILQVKSLTCTIEYLYYTWEILCLKRVRMHGDIIFLLKESRQVSNTFYETSDKGFAFASNLLFNIMTIILLCLLESVYQNLKIS